MIKFLADMGISPTSVAYLRALGFDTIHLHEQGLDRLEDPNILEQHRDVLEKGAIFSVNERRTWVRRLPIR